MNATFNVKAFLRRSLPHSVRWRLSHVRLGYIQAPNFGDLLSPIIIERLFQARVVASTIATADLLAVGSLMEKLRATENDLRPMIWGTGFIEEGGRWDGLDIKPLAVRGELSLERVRHLVSRPVALGDPGLLVSRALPQQSTHHGPISIVPHYVDIDASEVSRATENSEVQVIDVRDDPIDVVSQIANSSIVFSSSLHGLIVADAFRVPNYWTPLSDNVIGGSYKFKDYYSVYDAEPVAIPLHDAIAKVDALRRDWSPRPRIEELQDGLVASFPLRQRNAEGTPSASTRDAH